MRRLHQRQPTPRAASQNPHRPEGRWLVSAWRFWGSGLRFHRDVQDRANDYRFELMNENGFTTIALTGWHRFFSPPFDPGSVVITPGAAVGTEQTSCDSVGRHGQCWYRAPWCLIAVRIRLPRNRGMVTWIAGGVALLESLCYASRERATGIATSSEDTASRR